MAEVAQDPFAALDPYELRHLFEHLSERKRGADMHRLLVMETGEGRNAWYAAQDRADDIGRFVTDVVLARKDAERESPRAVEVRPPQVLYMLMLASVNSMATRLSADLAVDAVRAGVWGIQRGLAVARRLPDDLDRALALCALAPLPQDVGETDLWSEALQAVRDIRLDHRRGTAIKRLGSSLPPELFPSLREILLAMDDSYYRADAALDFAMRTQATEVKREMLTLATKLQSSMESPLQGRLLLTKCVVLRAQLGEFKQTWNELKAADRVATVSGVVECFQKEDIEQGCNVALEIPKLRDRNETLADFAARAARVFDLAAATKILGRIDDPDIKDAGLARTVVALAGTGDIGGARDAVRQVRQASRKCLALARIALLAPAELAGDIRADASKMLDSVFNVRTRGECLTALALGAARAGDAAGAQEIVRQITLPQLRTAVVCAIAPYLPDPAPALYELARTEPYETLAPAIAALGVELRGVILRNLIDQLNEVGDLPQCLQSVARYAALHAEDYDQLVAHIPMIANSSIRSTVIIELSRHASAPVLEKLYSLAKTISDATLQAATRAALLPRQVKLGYPLVPALREAMALPDPQANARAWLDLAGEVPSEIRQEVLVRALEASRSISDPIEAAEILVDVARQDAGSADLIWNELLDKVEGYASRFRDHTDVEGANRVQLILRTAAPNLPAAQANRALAIVEKFADLPDIPRLVLVQRLVELNEIQSARRAANAIPSHDADGIRARLALWRSAPAEQRKTEWQLLVTGAQELTGSERPRVLAELAEVAPDLPEKTTLLRAATQSVESIETTKVRVKPVTDLEEQSDVLLQLASQWAALDEMTTAMALWARVLHELGRRSREFALTALPAVAKVLDSDPAAVYFARVSAVRKVVRWWP